MKKVLFTLIAVFGVSLAMNAQVKDTNVHSDKTPPVDKAEKTVPIRRNKRDNVVPVDQIKASSARKKDIGHGSHIKQRQKLVKKSIPADKVIKGKKGHSHHKYMKDPDQIDRVKPRKEKQVK